MKMENPYNISEEEIKYCKRCGRKLRSAESKERGYGKMCYAKAQSNMKPLFIVRENENVERQSNRV